MIKKPEVPCYGCKDRTVLCHATCEKYIIYKKEHSKYSDAIIESRKKSKGTTWTKTMRKQIIGR